MKDILGRYLPPLPAMIADIGGGSGRYALWLAEHGYQVYHRDLVELHVQQLLDELARHPGLAIDTTSGDARQLGLPDASMDALLLLGPLYHLPRHRDRVQALTEVNESYDLGISSSRPPSRAGPPDLMRLSPRRSISASLRLSMSLWISNGPAG
jgi:SAM-dependent methyltransferase